MHRYNARRRDNLRKALTILLCACAAIFAQDLPKIAVYVTGDDINKNEKNAFGAKFLETLAKSGRYSAMDDPEPFLGEIDMAQAALGGGAIGDRAVCNIAETHGLEYVCIADIAPAEGEFKISARIIKVEIAEVVVTQGGTLKSMAESDLEQSSSYVVGGMIRAQHPNPEPERHSPPPQPVRKTEPERSPISWLGGGLFYTSDYGGGLEWSNGRLAMPYNGFGFHAFAELKYAELAAGISIGNGRWSTPNEVPSRDLLPSMGRFTLNLGAFAKVPIGQIGSAWYPIAGIEYELSMTSKLRYKKQEMIYVFGEGSYDNEPGDLSAPWAKAGLGFDLGDETGYFRIEILYGVRLSANAFEEYVGKNYGAKQTRAGHGLTIKLGLLFRE
jgi:hypothetical protein